MKKYLFLSYLLITIISSCERPPSPVYTIEGYIYQDCSLEPFAAQNIELYQDIEGGLTELFTTGGILATTTTDSMGHFKFTYCPENNLEVLIQSGGNAIIGVPIDTNIHDLVAYNIPSCNIQVSLNVLNAYTSDDTLYCTNLNDISTVSEITGPFTNGFLYFADGFQTIGMHYETTPYVFRYKVNGGPYGNNYIDVNTNLIQCDSNSIVLDIL